MPAIQPYTGPFGKSELLHLLRRTLFGVSLADLQAFTGKSLNAVVDELLTIDNTPPPPPLKVVKTATINGTVYEIDPTVPFGSTWVGIVYPPGTFPNPESARKGSLKAWWMGLMIQQDRNIREKMTLFWHNHMPIEVLTESVALSVYAYAALIRQYALGNFKDLVREMTINPGMLRYLNGEKNSKTAPDENYARELQELFCVGKGPGSGYTEDDVKAAAKVLTGWRVDYTNGSVTIFNQATHDTTDKQFSAFYNNTIIKGQTGADGGMKELNALLDMIFATEEVSRFIARKLYAFFVYYDYNETIEAEVIEPLAQVLRDNNYEIKPVLKALFTSEHFFKDLYRGAMIKSPMDYIVGLMRSFDVKLPTGANQFEAYYKFAANFVNSGNNMQMNLGDPPNVSGWPAYYQEPTFHEFWMNTVSYIQRENFNVSANGNGWFSGQKNELPESNGLNLKLDCIAFVDKLSDPSDPNVLIAESLELLFGVPVSPETQAELKTSILLKGQASDYYWSDAWNNYKANPSNANKKVVNDILLSYFNTLFKAAEFHLH